MHIRGRWLVALVASAVAAGSLVVAPSPAAGQDRRGELTWLSRHTDGETGDWFGAWVTSITPDGRYALFNATADGITPGDGDGRTDAFLADLDTGAVRLVSPDVDGAPGLGGAYLTDDASVFLEAGDEYEWYLRDVVSGERTRIAPDEGANRMELSRDGSTLLLTWDVMFEGHRMALEDVATGERTELPFAEPVNAALSADGSVVVFNRFRDQDYNRPLVRWEDGVETIIGWGVNVSLHSISRDASTLVYDEMIDDQYHTFVWREGVVTQLDTPEDPYPNAVVTPDGTALVMQRRHDDGGVTLYHRDLASGAIDDIVTMPGPNAYIGEFEIDADGSRIAYVASNHPDGPGSGRALWYHDRIADTTDLVCCTNDHTGNIPVPRALLLSDDGEQAVFVVHGSQFPEDPDDEHAPEAYAWSPRNATVPTLSIGDSSLSEGDVVPVELVLSQAVAVDVHVDVAVAGTAGPADATVDEVVPIPAGSRYGYVTVRVLEDELLEGTETLELTITSDDVAIGRATGIVTIHDVPLRSVSIGDVTRPERGSDQWWSFPLTLSEPSGGELHVQVATRDGSAASSAAAGNDYRSKSATIAIPAGTTSATFDIRVFGDAVPEQDETFTVEILSVTGAVIGDGEGIGTIIDDDTPIRLPRLI